MASLWPSTNQLDQAAPCHQRWLVCQQVTSAESCCHQFLCRRTVPCCFMQGVLIGPSGFVVSSQPFCIPSHAQRPGNSERDIPTAVCPALDLAQTSPPYSLSQLALPAAGYGLLFHHINSYQVLPRAHWERGRPVWQGDQACQKRQACDRQTVEPSVPDVVPRCHGTQTTVESVLGRRESFVAVVSTRAAGSDYVCRYLERPQPVTKLLVQRWYIPGLESCGCFLAASQ